MPQDAAPNPSADADQLEAATDQAIAACGGNAREAVRALIVANEFLESVRGRFTPDNVQIVGVSHVRSDLFRCTAIRRH
jgi:hypothetical protein